MKKQVKFLLFLRTFATFVFLSPLTACQSNGLFVSTNNFTFLTTNRFINVPIHFRDKINTEVRVEIENAPTNTIRLEQDTFNVSDRDINLQIKLDDSVTNDAYINFDLAFRLKSTKGVDKVFRLYDFVYYYQVINPEIDDLISVQDTTYTSVNKHFFMYDLYFNEAPDSDKVKVELLDDSSNKLKLRQEEFPIEIGTGIKSRIILDLDLGIFQNQAFSFNLRFTFINSKHKVQETTLYGFVAFFIKKHEEQIPDEYFDLVTDGDDRIILRGIKESVDSRDLTSYTKLVIPDNVVEIADDAFGDEELFANILQLNIPDSVTEIGTAAFDGLINLNELDLSSYETVPDWAQTETPIFNRFMTFDFGFVWVSKNDLNISEYLHEEQLPINWKDYSSESVTGNDFYKFNDENTQITGISEEGLARLEEIKVIKIPDHIKYIEPDVFDPIKKTPFIGTEGPETRLLLLNSNIESLPNKIFQNAGISGPIIITSPYISTLPESAFENCSSYDDPLITGVKEDEDKSIYFFGCNNLTRIGDYAFSMFKASNLSLPHNIQEIGSLAFQCCSCEWITIPKSVVSVGPFAFADAYSAQPVKKLSHIDLSDYDEILNPEAEESQQTYIPSWLLAQNSFTFLNVCIEGDAGTLYLSTEIRDEVTKNNQDLSAWEKKIKLNHGIPPEWVIFYS